MTMPSTKGNPLSTCLFTPTTGAKMLGALHSRHFRIGLRDSDEATERRLWYDFNTPWNRSKPNIAPNALGRQWCADRAVGRQLALSLCLTASQPTFELETYRTLLGNDVMT